MLSDKRLQEIREIKKDIEEDDGPFNDEVADALTDLLAEIERLRGELAARPVVLSRNKSDAIRIGATESLIPKEKD